MILKDVLNRMAADEWMTLCIQGNGQMCESSLDEFGPTRVGLSQRAESPALLVILLNEALADGCHYMQVRRKDGGFVVRRLYK